jgi:hypothetical protein
MDIVIEQETSLTTLAALSISAKTATGDEKSANNQSEKIEYLKSSMDDTLSQLPNPTAKGCVAFFNMPVCDPIEISFKDLSYSVQKLFSKCKYSSM